MALILSFMLFFGIIFSSILEIIFPPWSLRLLSLKSGNWNTVAFLDTATPLDGWVLICFWFSMAMLFKVFFPIFISFILLSNQLKTSLDLVWSLFLTFALLLLCIVSAGDSSPEISRIFFCYFISKFNFVVVISRFS